MSTVGFLTYDLQPFTEDCLYRIANAIAPVKLKAYPVFFHKHQEQARVEVQPSRVQSRHLGVSVPGSTPEGFTSNANFNAAWQCAKQSDVVVLFGLQGISALFAALCASVLRRPLISVNQTLPVAWERRRRWWVRWLKQRLLNRCHNHIYQTPLSRDVLAKVYGVREDRLFYAPFEAGASWFKLLLERGRGTRDTVRERLNARNATLFLFVGTLLPLKGIPTLIRAAAQMPRDADFLCVFAGPEEPRQKIGGTVAYYMELARDAGVAERMRFVGALPPEELAQLYVGADVIILPTHKDCFPKVLVEGTLAGRPLITTSACGAVGCMIVNEKNGFVIEPGDTAALAAAMTRLLDKDLRRTMGERSLELVKAFCDADAETKGFLAAIRATLPSRPEASP